MNSSLAIRINPAHLTILSHLSKILYDDVTYIVLEYIMNSRNPLVEEQEMAMNLNLSNPTVRKSLIMLEKHGILQALLLRKHILLKSQIGLKMVLVDLIRCFLNMLQGQLL